MGGIMEASMLYNLLNQGTRPTYMFDPSNMLLLDIRNRENYERSHITRALHLKEKDKGRFCLPFDCRPEMRWHICVYDEDSTHLDIYGRLTKIVNFLVVEKAFSNVFILKGGFRKFSRDYSFMCTRKVLYLPKALERADYYPLEIVHEFLYLMLPMHKLPTVVIENLRITAKVVCFSQTEERQDTEEITEGIYPESVPVRADSLYKFLTAACELMSKQRENHGRVVIVTNEYNRLGTTLSMAYLIAQEGKTLKEAWAIMRKAYLTLRPRWEFLEQLALFEQEVKKTDKLTVIMDEEFL